MPTKIYGISRRFADTAITRIFDVPIEEETPAARVKQIGIMVLLDYMRAQNIEPTMTNIIEMAGVSRQAAFAITAPLVKRGLLIEESIPNSMGRGRATRLIINDRMFWK